MAITPPVKDPAKNRLYKIPEAAEVWQIPLSTLYQEIHAGRLKAKIRRGNLRGYLVTAAIMDDWIENCLVDVCENSPASESEAFCANRIHSNL